MAQTPTNACLTLRIKNRTARELPCPFLGPHGLRLGPNETVTLAPTLGAAYGGHSRMGRRLRDLDAALTNGLLELVATPAVHLLDAATGDTKTLALDNGTLGTVDPCWDESGSSA